MTADAIAKKNELIALSLLRRILYFNFHMVPPAYSRYLQSLMLEGSEPLEGLSKLYHELQQSVGWARYAEDDMGKACEMMEKEDLEGFEGVRNKVHEEHVDGETEEESGSEAILYTPHFIHSESFGLRKSFQP